MTIRNTLTSIVLAGALALGVAGCKDKSNEPQPQVSSINYQQNISTRPGFGYIGSVSVASGDLNGDGYSDLVVGDPHVVMRYFNDGSGNYSNARLIVNPNSGIGYGSVLDIELSDIDGDGDLDLIVADAKGVATFKNDGAGNFSQ